MALQESQSTQQQDSAIPIPPVPVGTKTISFMDSSSPLPAFTSTSVPSTSHTPVTELVVDLVANSPSSTDSDTNYETNQNKKKKHHKNKKIKKQKFAKDESNTSLQQNKSSDEDEKSQSGEEEPQEQEEKSGKGLRNWLSGGR